MWFPWRHARPILPGWGSEVVSQCQAGCRSICHTGSVGGECFSCWLSLPGNAEALGDGSWYHVRLRALLEPKDSEFLGSWVCLPGAEAETEVVLAGLASGIPVMVPGNTPQPGCRAPCSWGPSGDAWARCSPTLLSH